MRAVLPTEAKANVDERTVEFVISTASVDRMGDTIAVDGWKLDNFRKNPVVLWAHDPSTLPIAKATAVWIEDKSLRARAEFAAADLSPLGDKVLRYFQAGFLNAVSVGFIPLKWAWAEGPDRQWGIDFIEQELLEFSAVSVPANAEALAQRIIEDRISTDKQAPPAAVAANLARRRIDLMRLSS